MRRSAGMPVSVAFAIFAVCLALPLSGCLRGDGPGIVAGTDAALARSIYDSDAQIASDEDTAGQMSSLECSRYMARGVRRASFDQLTGKTTLLWFEAPEDTSLTVKADIQLAEGRCKLVLAGGGGALSPLFGAPRVATVAEGAGAHEERLELEKGSYRLILVADSGKDGACDVRLADAEGIEMLDPYGSAEANGGGA